MSQELEIRPAHQRGDILRPAGLEVVRVEHAVTVGEQSFAQMGPEKSRAPRDENPFVLCHAAPFLGLLGMVQKVPDMLFRRVEASDRAMLRELGRVLVA